MEKEHLNFMCRVGEKHITNEGYEIEIIKYFSNINCTIQFKDGLQIKNRQYVSIVKGIIKNPNHKSVLNIGFLGVGDYGSKTHNPRKHNDKTFDNKGKNTFPCNSEITKN